MFIESHECESKVKNGLIDEVECEEKSTYKIGSRGTKGVQAVVSQKLKLKQSKLPYDKRAVGPFTDVQDITFEFTDQSVDDLEYKNFDAKKFIADVCKRTKGFDGLDAEHANNFRALVNKLETYRTEAELLQFHADSKKECEIGGYEAVDN